MKHLIHNPANARSGSCLGMCCSIVEPVPPTVSESFYFFPKTTMYKVRLNYCLNIEARSSAEAHRKAATLIRQQPGLALKGVETKGGVSRSEMPSLWKMFLFGW